jgi:NAD(P)-dependent dehydrogenase (short-subunit alcohol dehydrogenase family)
MQHTNDSTQSIVITGGASGIGAAVARKVIEAGGYVGILDLNAELAQSLAQELGDRAIGIRTDALDESAVTQAYARLERELPPATGLVNCAGAPPIPRVIEEQPVQEWQRVLDSHLKTTYISCRVIGSALAKRGEGAIVNVASVLSFLPGPVLDYGPAKAGVVNLTQSLAVHWARRGVRVNAVAPGWTDTPFLRPEARKGERDLRPILAATPMGRLMQPSEIADVICFLLSPAASSVTGVTVPCDGGVIAGTGWAPYGGFP